MKKYAPQLFILFVVILALALFLWYKIGSTRSNNEAVEGVTTNQPNPSKEFICPYEELRINRLPLEVQSNEVAIKTIKDNCLWATAQLSDLDSDGEDEILLTGVGYGCGSCHAKVIFIIDEDKVAFQYEGDDSVITPTKNGFQIKEPVRKENEPLCCPSESVVNEYKYEEGLYKNTIKSVKW